MNDQIENQPMQEKTWEDIRKERDVILLWIETQYNFDSPENIKKAWRDYKQALRDLPKTNKDVEDLNTIEWPAAPDFSQQLNLSRLTR